jgi:hypothetical protein
MGWDDVVGNDDVLYLRSGGRLWLDHNFGTLILNWMWCDNLRP